MLFIIAGLLLIVMGLLNYLDSFRVSEDSLKLTTDKVEHAVGSGLLFLALMFITRLNCFDAYMVTIILGMLWEIKDGFVPYERYGWIGGDGCSVNDLTYDIIGAVIMVLIIGIIGSLI